MRTIITLEQFILEREKDNPQATGSFSQIIRDLMLASRIVNREVSKAGLVDILGAVGTTNVQGEEVQKLDIYAEKQLIDALKKGGETFAVGSEEQEDMIMLNPNGKYIVMMDPLDGSSNIDVNVSIGTIFSIYRKVVDDDTLHPEDYLQNGRKQIAAGYVLYGPSAMLVYTTGNGVNGFTLDPSIGEFLLSHHNIKYPPKCNIYSINEGNYRKLYEGVKQYLRFIKTSNEVKKPYTARYIGSLVSDFHRNLLKGGIYLYPGSTDKPEGKLRLMYEGNPMAFLAEQAGGMATNGYDAIMDIAPRELHQRTPLFVGNSEEVNMIHNFIQVYEQISQLVMGDRYQKDKKEVVVEETPVESLPKAKGTKK